MGHITITQLIAFIKATGNVGDRRGQAGLNFTMEPLLKLFGKTAIRTRLGQ